MTDSTRQRLLSACYRFLLPIAKVLLKNGISYNEFELACKQAFVHVASADFGKRGRETNSSRISAMTGISRKQVQELRRVSDLETAESRKRLSPLADLVHEWSTNDSYLDGKGHPRRLRMENTRGVSFTSLVKASVGDRPAGAVKTELLRLGVVSEDPHEQLVLNKRSLVPTSITARLESGLVYSLRSLAWTIQHNTSDETEESERFFERFVESRPCTESEIRQIREMIHSRLVQISEEIDSLLNGPCDQRDTTSTRRVGVGIFYSE